MARAERWCRRRLCGLVRDAQLVALRGKDILVVGFGQHNPGRQLPGPELAEQRYRLGLLAHQLHRLRCGDCPRFGKPLQQHGQPGKVIEMAVGNIDRG